jgi:hypothetical protein
LQDGIGTQARFNNVHGVAIDNMGNLYVADKDNHSIRKVEQDGKVSTIAGTGIGGLKDGLASQAQFLNPMGVTVDHLGNIYVADTLNHRIRKITSNGQVTTVAGSGSAGTGQGGFNDGFANQARFDSPSDVVVDRAGNLYVADSGNGRIRKISSTGQVSSLPNSWPNIGIIKRPVGLVFDVARNLFIACEATHQIYKISFAGSDEISSISVFAGSGAAGYRDAVGSAAQFNAPQKLVADLEGNLYVADNGNHKIRRLDTQGKVTTVAGTLQGYQDGPIISARFLSLFGIALDAEGSIYVGDGIGHRIRKLRMNVAERCTQEGLTRSCYTGPKGTEGVGICKAGTQACRGGAWSLCVGQLLPQAEVPNGEDDNCNGKIDDVWEVRRIGGTSRDIGYSIAVDSSGNAYITGHFSGIVAFGATTLTSAGYDDIYVAKVDSGGNFLWAKRAGGPYGDWGYGIAVDSSGNTYITGISGGTAVFGATTLTFAGGSDIYVAKADSGGNFLWAKRAGGPYSDWGFGIAVDSSGNAYITGYFDRTAVFGVTTLTSTGGLDIYVAKVDSGGNFLWAKRAGGNSGKVSHGIVVDSSGNAYITGSSNREIYVSKVDSGGNFLWAKRAGGTSHDKGYGIAVDSSGNTYITGYFREPAVFGATTLTSVGGQDIFVAKLDGFGNFLWAKRAGGTSNDEGYGIAVDGSGNAYITGVFHEIAVFGATTLTSAGGQDIFMAKMDSGGNFLWAKRAGGTNTAYGYGISVDSSGNAYVTGVFWGTAVFGATTLTSAGDADIFIWKVPAP